MYSTSKEFSKIFRFRSGTDLLPFQVKVFVYHHLIRFIQCLLYNVEKPSWPSKSYQVFSYAHFPRQLMDTRFALLIFSSYVFPLRHPLVLVERRLYSSFKDPYVVLGLQSSASTSDIKRAYFDVLSTTSNLCIA